ncbi:MAG TPA: CoA pyrophosphatase [Burkholderiaceae bacterium]|nr:CoA pyrophosphatase [Burkholderiaceae bacterium]
MLHKTTPVFDPRKVPVVGTGEHLRAVHPAQLSPEALRQRFQNPPIWTPEVIREASFTEREPANAAVLIPLVMRDELMVLLTQRTQNLSTHAGQIAFPGGKSDLSDTDNVATALRESQEEIGLDASFVEVIGSLPNYITGTHFIVSPVIALIKPGFHILPNPIEVDHVFEVPLSFLMHPGNHNEHEVLWQGQQRRWFSMPYPKQNPDGNLATLNEVKDEDATHFIWGATAGMLRNLYRFLIA